MKAKELEGLIFSPFHTSNILHHFLSGVKSINQNGVKTELIYLVLPIVYNDIFCERLSSLNKKSKFSVLTERYKDIDYERHFLSVLAQMQDFKKVTKDAILLLSIKTDLTIGEYLSVSESVEFQTEGGAELKMIYKAAYYLGVVLAKERYTTVFTRFKILEI